MALEIEEGDYLGSYQRFFQEFISNLNPNDQLPVKTCGYDVTEGEIVGEIIDTTLQYLNQKFCPPSLQTHLVRLVIDEVKSICQKQPADCGLKRENKYGPLKLMQAVISKINEICFRYLDNSRLALLPPPPSIPLPLTTSYAIKNTRRKMEDRSVVLHDLNTMFSIKDDSIVNYYAVFDGHGGQDAAVYCAAHLHQYLVESSHYPINPILALRDAFFITDTRFIEKNINSGSTAVCALLVNKTLYIAWAGDSQAAIVKNGSCRQLVKSHKPNREDEAERVEKLGGCVVHFGVWRVNGNLNVSRSIGDKQYKPFISSEPETLTVHLDGTEDFLIIACDGFWDCINEEKAAEVLYELIEKDSQNYEKASHCLVDVAKSSQSQDNISVIVVFLTHPTEIAEKLKQYRSSLALRMDPDSPQDVQHPANFNSMETGSYPCEMNFGPRDDHPESIHAVDMGCCPFEMNFTKHQPTQQTNGTLHLEPENFILETKSTNGKHENGSANYDDDDDDDDDDEDDDDLGPETDVDAVDEAGVSLGKISRELFPEKSTSENDQLQKEENLDDSQESTDSKSRQNELLPEADNVADSEDSEDEWNYYRVEPDKDKDSPVLVNETSNDSKEEKDACSPKLLVEDDTENELLKEKYNCLTKSETKLKTHLSELSDTECSADITKADEDLNLKLEPEQDSDKMDFHLNPDAKEFIPPSMFPQRITDFPISGSPLKQPPAVMDDILIPSQKEFEEEVSNRPSDIEDEDSPLSKPLEPYLDDSEISSTKAEFGDESTTSFLTTSEFQRTGVSGMDYSFADSERGDYDIAKDPMAMSFTPGDFEAAFEKEVDLNAVHDLTDVDFSENLNGFENDISENGEKPVSETEKKESMSPFVVESDTQNSPNPFNMESLKESLNDENLESKYSETESEKVDACLIDTNAVPFQDNRKMSESEENSQDLSTETHSQVAQDLAFVSDSVSQFDYQQPFEPQTADLLGNDNHQLTEQISKNEDQNLLENAENVEEQEFIFGNKANVSLHNENISENKLNPFENNESPFENKESLFENNENILENNECFFASKENKLENNEIVFEKNDILFEDKEKPFESKEENLMDTPTEAINFEPENQADFEFDPEIQEKSQTQFELSLEEDHLQKESVDLGKFSDEIDKSIPLESEKVESHLVIEQKTNYEPVLNLSESLQEFTGLERQVNEAKELKIAEFAQVTETSISKENIDVEQKDVVENVIKDNDLVNIETQKIDEPKSEVPVVAAVIAGAAAVAATTAAVSVAKKPAATLKSSTTKTTTTKAPTKPAPTSPMKASATARTTTAAAKKPAPGTISRPKQLDTTKQATNSANKLSAFRAAPVPKTSSTAPKITPRLAATASKPKTPLSSPKPASAAGDKKSALNGDVKSLASKTTAPKPTTKPASTTATKTTLVKSSSTTRTSTNSVATAKPKPISAVTKTTSTAPKTATATTRPKTAPASTGLSVGAVKSRVLAPKSPVIDKQIKETANKQISSRVSSAPLKSSRSSTTAQTTTTMTVKRTTTVKSSALTSPTKKSAPLTKTTTTTSTKSTVTKASGKIIVKSKPLENGNCEPKKIETVTNLEEDVPKKDISPIAPPTDNQLITSE